MSEPETQATSAGQEISGPQGSPFWRFSLRFYRQPGVADACIALQDGAGVDVNLLLFLLWQSTLKRTLSASEVEGIEQRIGPWRQTTVVALRTLRRALKTPPTLVAPQAAELFRTRVKAVELEAERLQQEAMFELAHSSPLGREAASTQEAARANVAGYAAAARATFPQAAIGVVLAALAEISV